MVKICSLLCVLLFLWSDNQPATEKHAIELRWVKSYADETRQNAVDGLKWALSYTGAAVLNDESIIVGPNSVTLDISKMGYSQEAVAALAKLHEAIKKSDEYKRRRSVDLGRYVTLLIGSPGHYYQIAGTPKNMALLLSGYTLKPETGYVNNSSVAKQHRKIAFSEQYGFNQLFVATEIDSASQQILEYETIELLPNGQLRFGIFDRKGNRINSAGSAHSNAGKPAKCMWCHESGIQQLFEKQRDFGGYLTAANLQKTLIGYRESNNALKAKLTGGVPFSKTQQHTLCELQYIAFMEPSAERLALEWGMPASKVRQKLSRLTTHRYKEFPFLGDLYHRGDVEAFAPFKGLAVPGSVREGSAVEVNHIK